MSAKIVLANFTGALLGGALVAGGFQVFGPHPFQGASLLNPELRAIEQDYATQYNAARCQVSGYAYNVLGWKEGSFKISFHSEDDQEIYFQLSHMLHETEFQKGYLHPPGSYVVVVDRVTNRVKHILH